MQREKRVSPIGRIGRRLHRLQVERADQRQIRLIQAAAESAPLLPGKHPVVFFNASTRLTGLSLNAAFSLISSWAVRLSGAPVVYFVCDSGMSRCVLGTNREDVAVQPPCRECTAFSRRLFPMQETRIFPFEPDPVLEGELAALDLPALETFAYGGLPLGELVLPSLRWILRRHHLFNDSSTQFLCRQYILSAWNVAREFTCLLDDVNPASVVLFNGIFYPEAVAKVLARRRGIRTISHEVGLRPSTAFFTTGEATAYPIDIPQEFELTSVQEKRLDNYLEQRFQGKFSMAGVQFWPEMKGLPQKFLQRAAGFRQIVPIFTNVIFDTSQGHANVLFSHMFAWLDWTLELIRTHPDTLFVLRAHPDESRPGKESRESVTEWAEQRHLEDFSNVIFVRPDEYLSSYELIQRSKFVMVYNSTVGLEACLLGTPVLCAAKARFTQLPTVFLPDSPEALARMAAEFLSAEKVVSPPEFIHNARRFLYTQLYRTAIPFDAFLEDNKVWQGYVRLKDFSWQALKPENNPAIKVLVEGILEDKPFLLDI
ncbi:MAG: hypothetical protein IT308_02070 [Anaerolineaceae bacterium]|nr:hypothetical protein [Anaerolineaceae bacterium]